MASCEKAVSYHARAGAGLASRREEVVQLAPLPDLLRLGLGALSAKRWTDA